MKKKTIIILIIIILIILAIVLIVNPSETKDKYQNTVTKTCKELKIKINTKKDLVLFIYPKDSTGESLETREKLKKNYSETLMYTIQHEKIKNNCIKEILEKDNIYADINNNPMPTAVLYKQGQYVAQITGLDGYNETEEYFEEYNLIKKSEIKESLTLKEYEQKINQKEYLLLIMTKEQMRDKLKKILENSFKNYSYDIINLYSEEGEKIKQNIESKYEIVKEYPRIFYFQNGKLMKSETAFDEFSINEFKESIDKLNN